MNHILCILTTWVVRNKQRERPFANTPHNPKNMKIIHTNNVDASSWLTFSASDIWSWSISYEGWICFCFNYSAARLLLILLSICDDRLVDIYIFIYILIKRYVLQVTSIFVGLIFLMVFTIPCNESFTNEWQYMCLNNSLPNLKTPNRVNADVYLMNFWGNTSTEKIRKENCNA